MHTNIRARDHTLNCLINELFKSQILLELIAHHEKIYFSTRRKHIPVGFTSASMPQRVEKYYLLSYCAMYICNCMHLIVPYNNQSLFSHVY